MSDTSKKKPRDAKQKVYLVLAGWDYEGADVQACVATEKEAIDL